MTRNENLGGGPTRRRHERGLMGWAMPILVATMPLWGCTATFDEPPEPDANGQGDAAVNADASTLSDGSVQSDGGVVCGNGTVEEGEECDSGSTLDATYPENCGCDGGTRERRCSSSCLWEAWSDCDPPECNGRGDCANDESCNCQPEYAGLLCESCNEPENYFSDGSDCALDPVQGTCEAVENGYDSDPIRGCEGRLAEYPHGYICEATNLECGGCSGRWLAQATPCIWDPECLPENCYCTCACPAPGTSVMQRRCPGGTVQESTCAANCNYALARRPNCWTSWSPDC